jgi:hypothetical protein
MDTHVPAEHKQEALLGPPLMLALALQSQFCLHASAVGTTKGVIALAGESGGGKSTLARYLAEDGDARQLVTDDILPIDLNNRGVDVLPRFPQLKLSLEDQPAVHLPERLPLAAIFSLGDPAGSDIQARRLSAREALLVLIRHAVASRLFGKELLARHMEIFSTVAQTLPVFALDYPRAFDLLPQVARTVLDDVMNVSLENG